MANYAILRVDKCKLAAVGRLNRHHERSKDEYKSNPDIDLDESYRNYHLIEPKKSYRQMILERIDKVGAKRRKDSVVMQDCLITASPEWIKGKSLEEQQEYFRYALDFVTERFGQENMLSAVVHMDETTPHMHFTFVPITKDGKLSSKSIIGGPKGMVQMQDDFYAYIVRKYPEISRGLPAKVTHRSHIPPYLFKNATTLYEHYNEICAAIQDIGMIGNAKKKDAALALLGRYAPEMSKMSEQLKITDKKVADLERSLQNKDSSISYYRSQNTEQAQEIDNLSDKLYELHRMQEELQRQIDLVPPDLLKQLEEEEKQRRREERKQKERERGGAR